MTKAPFKDGYVINSFFNQVPLDSKKVKIGSKLIFSKWKSIAWVCKRTKFWAIVYEIEITSETDFHITGVSVLGVAEDLPELDKQGLPFYRDNPMPKVAPVARWQLIEASNKFNELAHELFAYVIEWAKLGADKHLMMKMVELERQAKKGKASARARLLRIREETSVLATPKKRISWTQSKLKGLLRRAEEIDRELDRNKIGEKQRDRNARLAAQYGVSVKTIEQRLSEARRKGFGSEKPKEIVKGKGK